MSKGHEDKIDAESHLLNQGGAARRYRLSFPCKGLSPCFPRPLCRAWGAKRATGFASCNRTRQRRLFGKLNRLRSETIGQLSWNYLYLASKLEIQLKWG